MNEAKIKIHKYALQKSKAFKTASAELLIAIEKVFESRLYLELECSSISDYCKRLLGLSDDVAANFVGVMHKSREVPELKIAIASHELTLSHARKIIPILTRSNQEHWISAAKKVSVRELENQIACAYPEQIKKETIRTVSDDYVSITIRVKKKDFEKIKRANDLVSKKLKRRVSVEETLVHCASEYVDRHDPIEKAKRNIKKPVPIHVATPREANVPARNQHIVNLRDQGRCQFFYSNGEQCGNTRFIETHHIVQRSQGGSHEAPNLITYCSGHHRGKHQMEWRHTKVAIKKRSPDFLNLEFEPNF